FQGGRCVSRGQVHVCRDEVCMDFIVHAGGCAWDEAGRPTQVLCLACDVTDLQRRRWSLRERLRELEGMEHIRRVALRAPSLDALYQEFVEVIAPRILSAGRRTAVLLEMDGQVWGNVRGPVGQALSAVVRVGGMNRGRLVLVHEERPGAGRGPGQAAVDRFAEVLGLVTYHMEIRAALTQSELRYRVLADDLMDFVCRFRLDGHITQANRAFALHLGTSPERLQGENFYTLHRDEGAGLRELVATLARGGRGGSVEIHAQSPTAEKRLLCWTLRILGGTEEALREIQAVGRVQRLDNGGGASVHTVRETV
ncbi:MAG: PAS domain-containing protein, partial [Desulfovibrionaceae bacterium]